MKILSAAQIKDCDKVTIETEKIKPIDLMERAANACLQWLIRHYDRETPFLVICGMGNNGGDGLALTRLLIENGFTASALILKYAEQFSEDASKNLKRLHQICPKCVSILNESDALSGISESFVLIDAVFGIGLNRPVSGWVGDFIGVMNELPNEKIAIDIPSGLPVDAFPTSDAVVFKVDRTLTFQLMKRSFLHEEGYLYSGIVSVLDIQLNQDYIDQCTTQYQITDTAFLQSVFKKRNPFSNKKDYGTAILMGGSYGMMGAVSLATMAALKSGVGIVKTIAPDCGYTVLQTLCPEAIFQKGGTNFIERIAPENCTALGIGPGLGQNSLTKLALTYFIKQTTKPLVLDADALNILAEGREELLTQIPEGSIITPHAGEFKRLFGTTSNSLDAVETARNQAMRRNIIIVMKGHYTAVLTPDGNCFYNITGNAGMAKGGSGDVLTGIVTGLLAQGYTAENAALLGVWVHGRAGDFAAEERGSASMTARDICNYLGAAFKELV